MTTAAAIAAEFIAQAEELEAAAAPSKGHAMICSENFIITTEFGALTFATARNTEGLIVATSTGYTAPHKANRFTRKDAETLAAACHGRAMFWRDACHAAAAEYRATAAMFAA